MLTIRKSQIEAFVKSQEDAFVKRMVDHLQKDFPAEITNKEILEKDLPHLVRNGLYSAYRYGIKYEDDVKLYIECIALLGPEFDTCEKFPQVREILNREDLDGEDKMDEISDFLTFGLEQSL